MRYGYSIKKTLAKALVSLFTIAAAFVAFTAFSDMTIWGLLEEYVKPLLGSLTVGGLITATINYLKYNYLS